MKTITVPSYTPLCSVCAPLQAKLLVKRADRLAFSCCACKLHFSIFCTISLVVSVEKNMNAHQGSASRRSAFSARRISCVFFLENLRPRRGPHGLSGWTGTAHTCCLSLPFQ